MADDARDDHYQTYQTMQSNLGGKSLFMHVFQHFEHCYYVFNLHRMFQSGLHKDDFLCPHVLCKAVLHQPGEATHFGRRS